ncbi:hypothetical protein IFM89_022476 [Coptis chinensis]|uniref:CCR4-NOT transcription complex subunit 10 n=1 Tax=Coptis chinensis TaxID=261450 RepID=A0A835IE34_9MAGN|nr:hypothetical protein IFM89_022476 [Coptis chinensis]
MDLRDSSIDGVEEDVGVGSGGEMSVTSTLGKEASLLFQSRKYSESLDVLNQLLHKKKDDPKVLHNVLVAQYFRDGCSDPRMVLEVLNKVKKRSEDLARASGEQVETLSNHVSSAISGSKGSSTTVNQLSASDTSTVYIDEYDASVATLNIAVVLFHLQEYANALSILEQLYQNIEPIDETIALYICLLLLDVALASHDARRAAHVLQYLEKSFGVCYGENGNTAQLHHSHQPVKTSPIPSNSSTLDVSTPDSSQNAPEDSLVRTLSDEALDYELFPTLEIGGASLVKTPGLASTNDLLKTALNQSFSALDLKLKVQLYKVRLLNLTRNVLAAKRELKLAMNIPRSGDSSLALFLKSQLEYARGSHRKAIKLLMNSRNRTESGMLSMFNNDLGCIYHQLKKHHTAALFFSKALKISSELRSEKPRKLSTFSQDKSPIIVYNCGLQYLICGRPIIAARCFQKAGLLFYNRPLLWLRIAECCLLALEKGFLELTSVPCKEVRAHVVGKGKWRQLVLEDGESRIGHSDTTKNSDGLLDGDDQQKLSIPFARQCLLNALHILSSYERKSLKVGEDESSSLKEDESSSLKEDESSHMSLEDSNHRNMSVGDSKASNMTLECSQASVNGDAKDAKGVASLNATIASSVSVYDDICRTENLMIKQAALADLAYVELTLENPLKALSAAKSLLELQDCSRLYIFLGHMYAAEALCCLNRPKEAAEYLSNYIFDGISADFPYSEEDREKWTGEKVVDERTSGDSVAVMSEPVEDYQGTVLLKPAEARGIVFVNLAASFGMQGDLEQAKTYATKALSLMPINRRAILSAVYVDLLLGNSQDALTKLKRCSRIRFLNSAVTFDNSS